MPKQQSVKIGGDFVNSAYNATATFGRVVAFMKMLLGVFVGIVSLIIGIVLIRSKRIYTAKTVGKVTAPKCTTNTVYDSKNRATTSTLCSVKLVYNVNEKEYTTAFDIPYSVAEGQTIEIQFNPENPSDIRLPQPENKTIGIILIIVGLLFMFATIVWFILTLKYKIVAAGTGAYTAADWAFGSND